MMDFYSDLVKQYGLHSILYAGSITGLCWLLFIVRYFSSNTERTAFAKFFDIIFMFFYIALFGTYLVAGAYIGNLFFDSLPIGVSIGIIAFWIMFELLALLKKKRTKITF